jgi:hypothetical protein
VAARDLFEVQSRSIRQVMVITPTDFHHRLPVVLVDAKDKSEDGDQDDW